MKTEIKIAFKNFFGGGIKSWLNSIAISFAFVFIIFYYGMIDGWNQQTSKDAIDWEYGYGHVIHKNYDPFNVFSLPESHEAITEDFTENLTPVLISHGNIIVNYKANPILIKGIDPNQNIVKIPTANLKNNTAVIGSKMASECKLKSGDSIKIQYFNFSGEPDTVNFKIVEIFNTNVHFVDNGQIWISIHELNKMLGTQNHATYFIAHKNFENINSETWKFISQEALIKPIQELINTKKAGAAVIYILLLAIGLMVIYDTVALAIFRRQKEIGTLAALGLTQKEILRIFIIEGIFYCVGGIIIGLIYGIPLFYYLARYGISFPVSGDSIGVIMAPIIYSVYSFELIANTIIILLMSSAFISYLAAKKITKMNIVDSLKGKAL